jgi:CRISPR-associated protein Cmr1
MPSLTLTLETVTPLLMNGADQTPEIRAASFRGVLRYWLRAVLGGIYQGDIGELKKAESRYFGSTEAGSPLRVRVEHKLEPATNRVKYVLPPTVEDHNHPGQRIPHRHPGFHESTHIAPQQLSLTLDTHPLCPNLAVFTPQLYAALLLAFHLGAFGKRSRRGGGVLRVIGCDADFALDEQFAIHIRFCAENQASLVNFLDNDLVPFVSAAQGTGVHPWAAIPTYPVWTPNHVKVLVGPVGYDDDTNANLGVPKPPFREGYRSALQEPWEVSGQKSLHRMKDAWGYAKGGRRASAVHMRVHLGADGLYYPLVTMIRSSPSDHRWGQLEAFDHELISRGYRRLAFCTGVWS